MVGETFCGGEERNDQGILGLSEMAGWALGGLKTPCGWGRSLWMGSRMANTNALAMQQWLLARPLGPLAFHGHSSKASTV